MIHAERLRWDDLRQYLLLQHLLHGKKGAKIWAGSLMEIYSLDLYNYCNKRNAPLMQPIPLID